ncbi:MAG: hypothetical protein IT323_13415 [Anaerolineae bacterium]|nr:hypothetical protein [Anaerolineae bacterium]
MIQAYEFVRSQPKRKERKVKKLFELTPDRAKWLEQFAKRKCLAQVDVIQAGIDELRRIEMEVAQTE